MEGDDGEEAEQQGWYSVWAQPSPTAQPPGLQPAMLHLRTLFAAPPFEPHVTVLGVGQQKMSLHHASHSLHVACRSLRPFTCRLIQPACGDSFYQCVYMLVETSDEVMHANNHVQSVFAHAHTVDAKKTGYMPHLSLLYADLTPEQKEEARREVEEKFGPHLCNTEFLVSSLCLYSTDTSDKLLTSWKKVAEFPLEGGG